MFKEAQYYVQLQAKRHELLMGKEKTDFKIHPSFLGGVSKARFHKAYLDLFRIFKKIYADAKTNPESMNLPLYRIDEIRAMGNEARESSFSLLWFSSVLFALGIAGTITDDKLIVTLTGFKTALKEHKHKKLELQIPYFEKQGFTFTNFDGKKFSTKNETFAVTYTANPDIFTVLCAAARKVSYAEHNKNNPGTFDLHRLTQFIQFQSTLFLDNTDTLPDYDDDYVLSVLEHDNDKEYYKEMMSFFREQELEVKLDPDLLKNRLYTKKNKDSLNYFEYTDYRYGRDNESRLFFRLKLNNLNSYIDYIQTLPSDIKQAFKNVGCGHCMEKCPRRLCYTIDGENKESCSCFSFQFWYPNKEYIPYYKELFLKEKAVKEEQDETKKKT